MKLLQLILFPISVLYAFILRVRNLAYNYGWIKSYKPTIPTICLGNLSMGGTGKTPHTKFLLTNLTHANIVVLSRGYGRKSTGFHWVDKNSAADQVGDEPLEIKRFSPQTSVAVCESRVIGIKNIQEQYPETEVVLLDDAYQHRQLTCSLHILLTTYNKPFFKDFILPTGSLRDNRLEANRATAIIVTKIIKPHVDKKYWENRVGEYTDAPVFYSRIIYAEKLMALNQKSSMQTTELKHCNTILITGLANPAPFTNHWKKNSNMLAHLTYPDHHTFTLKDIHKIRQIFDSFVDQKPVILTTEKDSMRLEKFLNLAQLNELPIFVSGIEIELENKQDLLNIINQHISTFHHVE